MRTDLPSAPPDPTVKTYKMYYGGQWHDAADGGHFDVHEPYSGKLFARVPTGGPQDAAAAIQAAAEAFPAWAATPPAERARLLLTAGEIVKRRRTEIADMLARETGSTISFSTFQQDLVADTLQQSAGWVYLPARRRLHIWRRTWPHESPGSGDASSPACRQTS